MNDKFKISILIQSYQCVCFSRPTASAGCFVPQPLLNAPFVADTLPIFPILYVLTPRYRYRGSQSHHKLPTNFHRLHRVLEVEAVLPQELMSRPLEERDRRYG
jgi:hypothetical protein